MANLTRPELYPSFEEIRLTDTDARIMPQATASRKVLVAGVIVAVVILGLVIAVIVLATRDTTSPEKPCPVSSPGKTERLVFLDHYNLDDGLDVTWYNGSLASVPDVHAAVEDSSTIVEVDVVQSSNQFAIKSTSVNLQVVLETFKPSSKTLKLNLQSNADFNTKIWKLIEEVDSSGFPNPVLISLPVDSTVLNMTKFVGDISTLDTKSKLILNFDLTTVCCGHEIGRGLVEYIDQLVNSVSFPCTVELQAANVLMSWQNMRWLIEKNADLLMIITVKGNTNDVTKYNVIKVRNDMDASRILYNLKSLTPEFKYLSQTGGSPLIYFKLKPRDAGKILWSHNTDTWEMLNDAVNGDVMMVEGDIQLYGQNTSYQNSTPIMGHDWGDFNNLTFEQWIDAIIAVDKGMKFDFKSIDAVEPALAIAAAKRHLIKGPIWLNADILQGPNANPVRIPANDFLSKISTFQDSTLSLGWTTVAKGSNYDLKVTMAMAQDMHDLCKDLKQPVTFPVRAEQMRASWEAYDWLLKQSRGYTLTVWTGKSDNVTKADMDFIKSLSEQSRVYFDLPPELRPTF